LRGLSAEGFTELKCVKKIFFGGDVRGVGRKNETEDLAYAIFPPHSDSSVV